MSDKLDGSFSGLWSCELCGKTGTACTCEHYQRDGNVWGKSKEFSNAEAAAEFWHQTFEVAIAARNWTDLASDKQKAAYNRERDRMYLLERFATLPGAWRMNYDGRGYLADL